MDFRDRGAVLRHGRAVGASIRALACFTSDADGVAPPLIDAAAEAEKRPAARRPVNRAVAHFAVSYGLPLRRQDHKRSQETLRCRNVHGVLRGPRWFVVK